VKYLGVPQDWEKEIAFNYYKKALFKLKNDLEKLTGEDITDEKLLNCIKKYNQLRDLLNYIGSLRKKHPPPIGGEDFIKLNHYALRCDLDNAINNLDGILEELKKREETFFSDNVVRIMMIGRGFAFGDYLLLSMIEESGGVVVSELLDEGILHSEKVKVNGNPIENLAESYYKAKVPSVFFSPSFRKRWEYIVKKVNEFHVDGLIYYNLAFDCIYDHEWPIFAKKAKELDIPFIMIESAYSFSREAVAALRSRVEAFIEMCRGKRTK
jgi:benzoyl-CoA reductase/2-hydroxyglutaryl-CoA dehydratase subunit BcrC/BadD/HgdB